MKKAIWFTLRIVTAIGLNGNMMKKAMRFTLKIVTAIGKKVNMMKKGNEIYYETRNDKIIDRRVKELTIEEIEKLLGYKIKN